MMRQVNTLDFQQKLQFHLVKRWADFTYACRITLKTYSKMFVDHLIDNTSWRLLGTTKEQT